MKTFKEAFGKPNLKPTTNFLRQLDKFINDKNLSDENLGKIVRSMKKDLVDSRKSLEQR